MILCRLWRSTSWRRFRPVRQLCPHCETIIIQAFLNFQEEVWTASHSFTMCVLWSSQAPYLGNMASKPRSMLASFFTSVRAAAQVALPPHTFKGMHAELSFP